MDEAKRCPKCGEVKPLDAFGTDRSRKDGKARRCRECRNQAQREWRAANRHITNMYTRIYYRRHRDQVREYQKKWRDAHKEERAAYQKKWRADNPDYGHNWYQANWLDLKKKRIKRKEAQCAETERAR
jgi:hypothetical protein